jgi:hypothetical protein
MNELQAIPLVRGFFAGALKKKLGLTVTSQKVEGGQRTYHLAAE